MSSLLCLLVGLSLPSSLWASPNALPPDDAETCRAIFETFAEEKKWEMSAALAKRIWEDGHNGRAAIEMALALIDLFTNFPEPFYDSLIFYLARGNRADLSNVPEEMIDLSKRLVGDGYNRYLARRMILEEVLQLAGNPVHASYYRYENWLGGFFAHGFISMLTSIETPVIHKMRDPSSYLKNTRKIIERRGKDAPGVTPLVAHSKYMRTQLAEAILAKLHAPATTSGLEFVMALIERAVRDPDSFRQTFTKDATRNLASEKPLDVTLGAALVVLNIFYPTTRKNKRLSQEWLFEVLANMSFEILQEEHRGQALVMQGLVDRIRDFVIEDAVTGTEYRAFFASVLLTNILHYDPLPISSLKQALRIELKRNIRSLAGRSSPLVMPRREPPPPTSLPAVIPQAIVGKAKERDVDSMISKALRERRKPAETAQATQQHPPLADDLDPFVSGHCRISELEADKPYTVLFRREHPVHSGPQLVVFSPDLIQDLRSHHDDRGTRARDWLEAIQQGMARAGERGIRRSKTGITWVVNLNSTRFCMVGKFAEKRWYFHEFRRK